MKETLCPHCPAVIKESDTTCPSCGLAVIQKRKAWREVDEVFLKANAKLMTAKELSKRLKRTILSVKSKAKKLGVSLQKHGEKHHFAKYSDSDVELCRQLEEAGLKPFEIAEKMELSYSYVQCILKYRIRMQG